MWMATFRSSWDVSSVTWECFHPHLLQEWCPRDWLFLPLIHICLHTSGCPMPEGSHSPTWSAEASSAVWEAGVGVHFMETSDHEAAWASRLGMAAFQGSFLIAVPLGHAGEHIPARAKTSWLYLSLPKHWASGCAWGMIRPCRWGREWTSCCGDLIQS